MARLVDTFEVDIKKACKRVRMGLGFPSPKYRSTQEIIGAFMSATTIQNIAVIGLGTIGPVSYTHLTLPTILRV